MTGPGELVRRTRPMAAACLVGLLAGCAASGEPPAHPPVELLYLTPRPLGRLYVEIDAVEGAEPDGETVAALRRFLASHCEKPGGIEIARGRPIPAAAVKGSSARLVALMNVDGPPRRPGGAPDAYLYVLFYDSRRMGLAAPENARMPLSYPCAIFFDVAYWRPFERLAAPVILPHEAGHVLGLCKNPAHGDGLHCRKEDCLMAPDVGTPTRRTWAYNLPPPVKGPSLCDHCRRDLQWARRGRAEADLTFRGPVLVRRKSGYFVAALPWCIRVCFGPAEDFDWREMLADVRRTIVRLEAESARTARPQDLPLVGCRDLPAEPAARRTALERVARDPSPPVAAWARARLAGSTRVGLLPTGRKDDISSAVSLIHRHDNRSNRWPIISSSSGRWRRPRISSSGSTRTAARSTRWRSSTRSASSPTSSTVGSFRRSAASPATRRSS